MLKIFILSIVTLLSFNAHAGNAGTYTCTSDAGWNRYQVVLKDVKLDADTTLPFVTYKKGSVITSGFAIVTEEKGEVTLSLGQMSLISFINGSVSDNCEKQQ